MEDLISAFLPALSAKLDGFYKQYTDGKEITNWLKWIENTVEDPRQFYLTLSEEFGKKPEYQEEAYKSLVKYLGTFNNVCDVNAEIEAKACKAVLFILSMPIWNFDEVKDLVPVRALTASKNAESKRLTELLDIFSKGAYSDYSSFHNNHGTLIEQWGLDHASLTEKVRLLNLCTLAHSNPKLTYGDIQDALGVTEDDVEPFVVNAIGKKLLKAKIDSVNKKLNVSYAHHPLFSINQWRQLQETLAHWQDQLNNMLEKMENAE